MATVIQHNIMATYTIVTENNGNVELTSFTSTRKRDIMKSFNRFINSMAKLPGYSVEWVREGYARYTYFGEYGMLEGEYYIIRN